jgi:hypothetical protein
VPSTPLAHTLRFSPLPAAFFAALAGMAIGYVALIEVGKRGDHCGGLRLIALERLHRQREPGRVGEQSDRDLRLESAFLGDPGSRNPSP